MHLRRIVEAVGGFQGAAHQLLAAHETSPSRVVVLQATYNSITSLSIAQDDLFRQSLRCVEHELYRAAHVLSWAGMIDYYEQRLNDDGLVRLSQARPKWATNSLEDLRESVPEFQLIEAGRPLGLLSKNDVKALHGLLNKRNECAHPSDYFPSLNDTLGFITELLKRIEKLAGRKLPPSEAPSETRHARRAKE